ILSPKMSGKSFASSTCSDTRFRCSSLCVRMRTSSMASFISSRSFVTGAFLKSARRRRGSGQASESPDKSELADDYVDDVTKLCLSCELQAIFDLTLHVAKRSTDGEKKCD